MSPAFEAAPAVDANWEEVVELSVSTEDGLAVVGLDGDPKLTITDDLGQFRLRSSSRGRAAGYQRDSSGRWAKVLEYFLIEVWRAPPLPPEVLRAVEPPPPTAPVLPRPCGHRPGSRHTFDRDLLDGDDRVSASFESGHEQLSAPRHRATHRAHGRRLRRPNPIGSSANATRALTTIGAG